MFKKSKKDEQDCYVFIEDGNIIKEVKDKNNVKIMSNLEDDNDIDIDNSSTTLLNDDLNSDEYAKSIATATANSLKEDNNPHNKQDVVNKIIDKTNLKSKKNLRNLLVKLGLIVFLILILFISIKVSKNITFEKNNSDDKSNTIQVELSDKEKKDFYFLLNIIDTSNSNIQSYYEKAKEYSELKNEFTSVIYNKKLQDIKESINRDIVDINSINNYIDTEIFTNLIKILEARYNNVNKMYENILNTSENATIVYNLAVEDEINLKNTFMKSLKDFLNTYNIPHSIDSEGNIHYK